MKSISFASVNGCFDMRKSLDFLLSNPGFSQNDVEIIDIWEVFY